MLICQVAREKYGVDRIIARVNNPRNRRHFELLDVRPYVSATDLMLRLIEHEVPDPGVHHLLELPEEGLEIVEATIADGSPAIGKSIADIELPEGSLLISVLREGKGFVPRPDTVLGAGDQVLAVLDPGIEAEVMSVLGAPARAEAS